MRILKLFFLATLVSIYVSSGVELRAADDARISEADIDQAVSLAEKDLLKQSRLKKILSHASTFALTDEAFEGVLPSRDVFRKKSSLFEDANSHTQTLLRSLGLSRLLVIDGPFDFSGSTFDGLYAQLSLAASIVQRDIIEPLSRLSFVLSYREGVKNFDEDGRLMRINEVIKKWGSARTEVGCAASYLYMNHLLSVR